MEPIRVVIADDHPVVRRGLRALLESLPGHVVVGEAADGAEAVTMVIAQRPDVLLLDLLMPGVDGLEAARRVREQAPDTGVLIMTMSDDPITVRAALSCGAHGYLLKGAECEAIERAVRAVAAGQVIFDGALVASVIGPATTPADPFTGLTTREREVLTLMADGLRNAQIAAQLFLSQKTIANHVSSILVKLAVPDRVAAVVAARRAGLGTQ